MSRGLGDVYKRQALMIAFNEGVKKIQVESEKISAGLTSGMGIPGF